MDNTGNFPFLILTGIIGAVIGAVVGGIIASSNNNNVWAGIAIGATAGGLIGTGLGAAYAATVAGSFFASTSAVVVGTQIMATTVTTGGIGMAGKMVIDNWSNAINQSSHVFWSGGDLAKNAAQDYANRIGGVTIEMTRTGQHLQSMTTAGNWEAMRPLWDLASANFANTAQGTSYAFVYSQNLNSVFWTVEYVFLMLKELIFM